MPETDEIESLRAENDQLRAQVKQLAARQQTAQGALSTASAEREATERLAHSVVTQERVTHEAISAQGGSLGLSVLLQILNFLMLLLVLLGIFFWLPGAVANRIPNTPQVVVPGAVSTP